jgi:hypothetical protein
MSNRAITWARRVRGVIPASVCPDPCRCGLPVVGRSPRCRLRLMPDGSGHRLGGMTSPEKLVLLILADHARDDGSHSYPGTARIVADTGLSERTVQKSIARLEAGRLLSANRPPGRRVEYTLHLDRTEPGRSEPSGRTTRTPEPAAPPSEVRPGTACAPPPHALRGTPASDAPEPSINPQATLPRPPGGHDATTALAPQVLQTIAAFDRFRVAAWGRRRPCPHALDHATSRGGRCTRNGRCDACPSRAAPRSPFGVQSKVKKEDGNSHTSLPRASSSCF